MNYLDTIILGILEGITEFLPISSTAHLILADKLMHLAQTEFLKTFEISIQLGAILSVIALYRKTLIVKLEVLKRVLTAFIPTAVIGLILYKFIKHFLMENTTVILSALFLGGLFIVIFDYFHEETPDACDDISKLSYKKAVLIGLFQSIAMIPGVSRSAATIIGGLILGIKRKTIVEFSFLLAIPTMGAATALDLLKTSAKISPNEWGLLASGFCVSFVVALASIKFLLHFIKKHNFIIFGIYRMLLAAALLFIF